MCDTTTDQACRTGLAQHTKDIFVLTHVPLRTNLSAAAKDIVSGWTVKNPRAIAITRDPIPLPPHITADDIPGMLAKREPLAFTIQRKVSYMGSTEARITTAVASVEIWRGGNFYVLNYVLCAFVLTFLSFVVYLMDETEVSNRTALALTIIVALNVFQIILNVEIPKTNYLTPLHTFYLVSVLLCAVAAAQSMAMYRIQISYDKTIKEIKKKKRSARAKESESKKSEDGADKVEGPESSVVYPEAFVDGENAKTACDKSGSKEAEEQVDVTKHGRLLKVQHWILTYFDRVCFVVVGIFYVIFSLAVVMVPRDPVIESSY